MPARTLAVGCPRWGLVAADLPPDIPAASFFANRVVSASPEAVASGIRKGMRRRDAQALCPELEVLMHDPARDARVFEAVAAVVESFSPRLEVVKPGLCVLPAKAPARYFGGEERLRELVAEAVDEKLRDLRTHPLHTDDRCRTGIADGPFAATLAATRGMTVPPGASREFLSGFPVETIDAPQLPDLLRRLGIRTLGDLAALPSKKVVARFGAPGEIAHRLARGEDGRLLELREPPPDLVVVRELDPPAERVDVAMFVGKSAADDLIERLAELGLGCAKLEISVQTEHGEELSRTWRYSATFTPAAVAERLRWQLEGWLRADRITGGISLLRLRPLDIGAMGTQPGLWSRRGEVTDRVRRAIARVQGSLGQDGASRPTLSGGRHPSEQVSLVAWGDPVEPDRPGLPGTKTVAGPVEVELPPWPGRLPPPSPAIVHPDPIDAEMVDGEGTAIGVTSRFSISAAPSRVRLAGKGWTRVVAWAGPWPVDERWWDESAHRRRARFQIALEDGSAHLLSLEGGRFRVEATYD